MGLTEINPTRPVLRYHGGKWRLAEWVISHFPPHRIYVEPFGGAASVLMRKPRVYAEIYNDLDGEVVNVFKVLRDRESAEKLEQLLRLTPFAREEFEAAYSPGLSENPIERARLTIIKAFMGFGSNAIHCMSARGMRTRASVWGHHTGFRANARKSGTTPARDWIHYPDQIAAFWARLQGVVIESRDATAVMLQHDREDTLHYVDPPYVWETRGDRHGYAYEMSNEDHRVLAEVLHSLVGAVVVSGYTCELYEQLYGDWEIVNTRSFADGARERQECLWLSPRVSEWLRRWRLF